MYILGISAFYHDAAACLLNDGEIVAGATEERFSRIKHDFSFPTNTIKFCLDYAGIEINEVDCVVFYEKPLVKFERIMKTFAYTAPRGMNVFVYGLPDWIKNRLWTRNLVKKNLGYDGKVLFTEHHESHAASAYFVSPFDEAAILTIDGIGEWASTTMGYAQGGDIELFREIHFPNSLGLLYSTFTAYLGFKVNNGEFKVMGMSAYGSPRYYDLIREKLIDVKKDASFALNMDYFSFLQSQQMFNEKFDELFGGAVRAPGGKLEQVHFDIAMSIQKVTEDIVLSLLKRLYAETSTENLCIGGG